MYNTKCGKNDTLGNVLYDQNILCKGYIEFHLKNPVGIDAYWVLCFYKSAKIL